MLDLLRSLEWSVYGACPSCRQVSRHTPDCRLDRAIRDLTAGKALLGAEDEDLYRIRFEAGRARYRAGEHRESNPCVSDTARKAWFAGWDAEQHEHASRIAREPTVDEMARDVRPTFADKLRALGLPTEMEHNGMYCHDHRGPALWIAMGEWVYSLGPHVGPGPRRWPTAETAVDELYAEWVAKQQAALGARPDSPPTDPSALAAWLYARVVPGRTIIEHKRGGGQKKAVIAEAALYEDDLLFVAGERGLSLTADPLMIVRLLNPDGTVLWEAS